MLKRVVEQIERFEEGHLSPSAFLGATVLFTLGWISYAATWALIGLVWYTIVRFILGYPI
jgi:ABC-type multidrug transport system permease subunit